MGVMEPPRDEFFFDGRGADGNPMDPEDLESAFDESAKRYQPQRLGSVLTEVPTQTLDGPPML